MNNINIPSHIDNLSQILEDGLILCNESGLIISSNDVARQFLNKKLNNRNIYEFIEIAEFKNLEESNQKNNLNEDQVIKVNFQQKSNINKGVYPYDLIYNKNLKYTPSRELYMHSYLQTHPYNFNKDIFISEELMSRIDQI